MKQVDRSVRRARWRIWMIEINRSVAYLILSVACVTLQFGEASGQERTKPNLSKYVDSKGNIALPADFETTFVHLGTIAVSPQAGTDVTELHGTYTRSEDLKAFQQDGHFPDGAILVKEVRSAKAEDLSTGHAQFESDVKIWFVMVKDSQNRFPDNDLWGDGWGWALFKGADRSKQVATNFRTDCRTCHVPAKANDWIYTQCYPGLKTKAVAPKKDAGTKDAAALETVPKPDLISSFPQWKAALTLKGNLERGRKYFTSKTINSSLTCASCHSFDQRDTTHIDGDGLLRAGFPVYASVHRTNIKRSGTSLAALGANVCVVHFMKAPEPGMNAQELADMDLFLHSGGKPEHPTAANVDYAHLTWTIPETLTGGDPLKGEALVLKSCITCHAVGDKPARILKAAGKLTSNSMLQDDLKDLALRIRNPEFKINDEMPGYSDIRLSNAELLDILAWFTKK
jgi:mono/diheme cytochrome c family protein